MAAETKMKVLHSSRNQMELVYRIFIARKRLKKDYILSPTSISILFSIFCCLGFWSKSSKTFLPNHGHCFSKVFLVFFCFFSASSVSMNYRGFPSLLGFSSNPDLVPDCLFVCLFVWFVWFGFFFKKMGGNWLCIRCDPHKCQV